MQEPARQSALHEAWLPSNSILCLDIRKSFPAREALPDISDMHVFHYLHFFNAKEIMQTTIAFHNSIILGSLAFFRIYCFSFRVTIVLMRSSLPQAGVVELFAQTICADNKNICNQRLEKPDGCSVAEICGLQAAAIYIRRNYVGCLIGCTIV